MQIEGLIREQRERNKIPRLLAVLSLVIVHFVGFIGTVPANGNIRVIVHWRDRLEAALHEAAAEAAAEASAAPCGHDHIAQLRYVSLYEKDGLDGHGLRHHVVRIMDLQGNAALPRLAGAAAHLHPAGGLQVLRLRH